MNLCEKNKKKFYDSKEKQQKTGELIWGLESWFEAWGKIEGLESLNQACNAVSLFISFLQNGIEFTFLASIST